MAGAEPLGDPLYIAVTALEGISVWVEAGVKRRGIRTYVLVRFSRASYKRASPLPNLGLK